MKNRNTKKSLNKLILYFAAVILFFNQNVLAQKEIISIDLTDNAQNLKSFINRDTLFITYSSQNASIQQGGVNLIRIFPDGTSALDSLENISSASICGLELNEGDEYVYFTQRLNQKSVGINAVCINRKSKEKKRLEAKIVIDQPIVDIINDQGLTIITRNLKKNSIEIITINRCQAIKYESYLLPEEYSNMKADEFDVVQPDVVNRLSDAISLLKIYVKKECIAVSWDKLISRNTSIALYDRKTKSVNRFTVDSNSENFKSFIVDSVLFRLDPNKKAFVFSAYKMSNGTLLKRIRLKRDSVPPYNIVYSQSLIKGEIALDQVPYQQLDNSWLLDPVIIAHKNSDGKYFIIWGTYFENGGVGFVASPNPVVSLLGSVVITTIKQAKRKSAVSRYLYSTTDLTSFELNEARGCIFKKMDDYEIENKSEDLIKRGSLIKNLNESFVFIEDSKVKKLRVIKF